MTRTDGHIDFRGKASFERVAPSVIFVYFLWAIILTMCAFQPVLIAISIAGALISSHVLRSASVLRQLAWMLPVLIIIAVINPLFSASGSTVLFMMGTHPIYLESLVFGACMGGLLIAAILWFANAAAVLTTDRVMDLLGKRLPIISYMFSMTLRLVPKFIEERNLINDVSRVNFRTYENNLDKAGKEQPFPEADSFPLSSQKPISAPGNIISEIEGKPGKAGLRRRIGRRARMMSVLVGWSLEDSLETADSMRCRGWGSVRRRTRYRRERFSVGDAILLAIVIALGALASFLGFVATSQFFFYPELTALSVWWGYGPYLLFFLLPWLYILLEDLNWIF
ncbi:MAG: energy-coupling factor transporter transmembrane protein EcfT [Eggerthellaceae bacterium]|nr:energy-coupling factor transporter transmembrane protein EcfT [Eggerthellaceae bacterium]